MEGNEKTEGITMWAIKLSHDNPKDMSLVEVEAPPHRRDWTSILFPPKTPGIEHMAAKLRIGSEVYLQVDLTYVGALIPPSPLNENCWSGIYYNKDDAIDALKEAVHREAAELRTIRDAYAAHLSILESTATEFFNNL